MNPHSFNFEFNIFISNIRGVEGGIYFTSQNQQYVKCYKLFMVATTYNLHINQLALRYSFQLLLSKLPEAKPFHRTKGEIDGSNFLRLIIYLVTYTLPSSLLLR
jgi:hypothetical protein